jgi:hypothetical protein
MVVGNLAGVGFLHVSSVLQPE